MAGKNVRSVKVENLFQALIFEGLQRKELKEGEHDTQVELLWERGDSWMEDRSEGELGISEMEAPPDRIK